VPDIVFGKDRKAVFPTKHHGLVTLSEVKWEIICGQPERRYYRLNGEKIATTLINPDSVRHHQHEPNQFFYYKRFWAINLNGEVETLYPKGVYFAVVIDASSGRICTVYPVEIPKPGKAFNPKASR
jgi:hypothetical protein